MKKLTVFLITCLCLTVFSTAQAQDDFWRNGCESRATALIESTVPQSFSYQNACEAYTACDVNGYDDPLCPFSAYASLVEVCVDGDLTCQWQALLFASMILTFDEPYAEYVGEIPPDNLINNVTPMLQAFMAGDYATAYNVFATEEYETLSHMVPLIKAILTFKSGGDTQQVIDYLNAVSAQVPEDPLSHIAFVLLYEEAGIEALPVAVEVAWLQDAATLSEATQASIARWVGKYPLETQTYVVYPWDSLSAGVGGSSTNDQTNAPAIEVQAVMLDNPPAFVVFNLIEDVLGNGDEVRGDRLVLRLAEFNNYVYATEYEDEWMGGSSQEMRITPYSDDLWMLKVVRSGFEYYSTSRMYFGESGVADPRPDIYKGERCEGGALARLAPNQRLIAEYAYLTIYPQRSLDNPLYTSLAIVTRERECVDGVFWWKVDSEEYGEAWLPETAYGWYQFNTTQHPEFCTAVLPPVFEFNEFGRVIEGKGANNMRADAHGDSTVVATIPELGEFSVAMTQEPVCADGYLWWLVTYNGITGWTAQGDANEYWIEVVPVE